MTSASARPFDGRSSVGDGPQILVNSEYFTSAQFYSRIAMAGDGRAVVVWQTDGEDGPRNSVRAKWYGADGVAPDPAFPPFDRPLENQQWPVVGINDGGEFVIVWRYEIVATPEYLLMGQRFRANRDKAGLLPF